PEWVTGAAAGAGAAVPAVALGAAFGLVPASWRRANPARPDAAGIDPHRNARVTAASVRWLAYVVAGGVAGDLAGPDLCRGLPGWGLCEWLAAGRPSVGRAGADRAGAGRSLGVLFPLVAKGVTAGVVGSLVWVAIKVGALSFGGGFVIIPLM